MQTDGSTYMLHSKQRGTDCM